MSDLKGADILLQRAIKKVEGIKKLDAAQVILRHYGRYVSYLTSNDGLIKYIFN